MEQTVLVLKFGGTSVKDISAMRKAVELCLSRDFDHVLVVSSAISGMTNKLVYIADQLKQGNYNISDEINEIVDIHTSMGKKLELSGFSMDEINTHLNDFKNLVKNVALLKNISDAEYAQFPAFGELLSTKLLTHIIQEKEKSACWFDARQVVKTDNDYHKALPDFVKIEKMTEKLLMPVLRENRIVITQGFLGSNKNNETTLLGRGGSDYSASILGAALMASQIEIWTDVDGLMTTDPRIVPQAKTIYDITYEEASELAYFGAKVLHPLTLLPSRKKGIPVLIRNTKNSTHPGTKIHLKAADDQFKGAKAIAFKQNITTINIVSSRMLLAYGFLRKVFKIFDEYKTPVDLVATSEVSISVTIDDVTNIEAICNDLREIGIVDITKSQTIMSIVGTGIRNLSGTAAKVFGAIKDININMISQGSNQTNLSFIIDDENVEKAVQRLHRDLIELNPEFNKQEDALCV